MQKWTITLGLAAVCAWVALSAQQETLSRPGPGSGITNVTGAVSITNTPTVRASQDGDWRVAIANTPSVRVAEVPSPGFLRAGARYEVTWADGGKETVIITALAANGWVEVEHGRRWINLTAARAIRDEK